MVDIALKEKKSLEVYSLFDKELFKTEEEIINAIIDIFPKIHSDIDLLLGFYNFTAETKPINFLNTILELFAEVESRDFIVTYDSITQKYDIKIKHEFDVVLEPYKLECEDIKYMVQEAKLMLHYIINFISTKTDCINLYERHEYIEMAIDYSNDMIEKCEDEEEKEQYQYILDNYNYYNYETTAIMPEMYQWLQNQIQDIRHKIWLTEDIVNDLERKFPIYKNLIEAFKIMSQINEMPLGHKEHLFHYINMQEDNYNLENIHYGNLIIICHSQDKMVEYVDSEIDSLLQNNEVEPLTQYLSIGEEPSEFPYMLLKVLYHTEQFIRDFYDSEVKNNKQLHSN